VLRAAASHRGAAFVEIYQNCPIFNDGAFDALKGAKDSAAADAVIPLRHGEPIRFGVPGEDGLGTKGVVRDEATGGVRVIDVTASDVDSLLVHDAHSSDPTTPFALSRLTESGYLHRAPVGIFRQVERPTYDDQAREQVATASADVSDRGEALAGLLSGGDTWTVA
jgi:2-oxoglutarate ferredoxin oxidoreductase subunit beta